MGLSDVFKILIVPAIIAAALYFLLAYAVIPLIRSHRQRYAQYLPLHSFSERTSSLRTRAWNMMSRVALPPSLRWRREVADIVASDEDDAFGEEEGESMVGFDVSQRDRAVRGGRVDGNMVDSQRRLSRELEEGFRDDSDEDSDGDLRSHARIS